MNLPKHVRDKISFKQCPGMTACWIWGGGTTTSGQPHVGVNGDKGVSVSRYTYQLYRNKIPDGKNLKRQCPHQLCVNPHHYQLAKGA